jgi:predicted N-formylglutamate amidohydrolase
MIEIRNDEIADAAGQQRWADRLADILVAARSRVARSHAVA